MQGLADCSNSVSAGAGGLFKLCVCRDWLAGPTVCMQGLADCSQVSMQGLADCSNCVYAVSG